MPPYIPNKTVDDYLNEVDFLNLNYHGGYIPSEFSLKFMNFIKLVNGKEGEDNKTPVMHLAMLDKLASRQRKIANLCARGTGKTTLFMEYFVLYLATFGNLPEFGDVSAMIYISDSMDNGVKSAKNSIETRYYRSEFLQHWVPKAKFTENYLEFENTSKHLFGVKMFGSKSGIRGTKIFNKRPQIALLDDLVSDADSKSKVAMDAIKATVYSGIKYAMDPKHKIILNGTPFNKEDIVYEAIESGAWQVNVWPICETFPCSKEDFRGAWEDRFPYEYVKEMYDDAVREGKLESFRKELMLRITSSESRLVQEEEILWVNRSDILSNKHKYNFYITTDFATSSKQTADYSVISVWAYDNLGNWTWVDGVCEKQTMDVTINDLFRLVEEYSPQDVGVEISGQQGAFIKWLESEMLHREVFFNLTKEKGVVGIRPVLDKLSRFNLVVPLFRCGKIRFPIELRTSKAVSTFVEQIALVTKDGIKGKDDCIDTISMLNHMNPWKPNENIVNEEKQQREKALWGISLADQDCITQQNDLNSYLV